jgi:hypothetical protein
MFSLTLVVLLLAGCAGAQVEPTATPAPISWDYVVLGDSNASTFPRQYADHIEADLGVEVTLHYRNRGDQSSAAMLRNLREHEELRSDIHEAEVVTFFVSPKHLQWPVVDYDAGTCGGPDNQDCLREALALLKADTDTIIAEILSLQSTEDTIIRAMTYYNFVVNTWKEQGCFEDLNPYWVAHNGHLIQAASEHNVPVARVDLAFNGLNLDEDPSDKGYLSDGTHPNVVGITLLPSSFRNWGTSLWRHSKQGRGIPERGYVGHTAAPGRVFQPDKPTPGIPRPYRNLSNSPERNRPASFILKIAALILTVCTFHL